MVMICNFSVFIFILLSYDFWYQPYHNVMISTEWGHPRCFFKGLDLADVENGSYGTHLNVYDWKEKKLIQKVDLGMEGVMPLEIRYVRMFGYNYLILVLLQISP